MLVNAEEWGSKRTVEPKGRKSAKKLEWKKIGEMEWSYSNASNSLTNFWPDVHPITGNGKDVNLLRIELEKVRETSMSELILWRILTLLESLWSVAAKLFSLKRGRALYGRRLPSVEDTKALTLLSLRTTRKKRTLRTAQCSGEQRGARARAVCGCGGRLSSWLSRKSSVQVWTTWSYYVDAWRKVHSKYICM